MVSMRFMPIHLLRSTHYYEPSSLSGLHCSEHAVNGAAVERFQGLRAHAKSLPLLEREDSLLCPLQDRVGVCEPC